MSKMEKRENAYLEQDEFLGLAAEETKDEDH